ncbi:hypothetical protein MOPEL_099_00340 [Mobilicoccus pelagius NBRC 104925]|uniref:Uncharacterized protein n=1 Tax=Mobilicoccus pelagius NBRC 104925 TaxID=1089455 RepID=H5UU26_9MICO|nr:hypothetical protein MOPEL_099_00340 [Mobilicoccus pelagius NBRC 104925]
MSRAFVAVQPDGRADVGTRRGDALPLPPFIRATVSGGELSPSAGSAGSVDSVGAEGEVAVGADAAEPVGEAPGAVLDGAGVSAADVAPGVSVCVPGVESGAAGGSPRPAQPESVDTARTVANRADREALTLSA